MTCWVQKFGGSSLADIKHIQRVADIVMRARSAGRDIVVVVSAMGAETDRLVQLSQDITAQPDDREYSALLASGEQVSAALVAMALQQLGCQAQSLTGLQAGIITDDRLRKASIQQVRPAALKKLLKAGVVPVVAGFQGGNKKGEVTTIGRGGSDMSAVAIAAALKADECQIYTDVAGVYTGDPRVVSRARCLERITFAEMLELANVGTKVIQRHAVEYAHKQHVPVRVLSTFKTSAGTLITFNEHRLDQPIVSGIALDRNQAKLSILGIPNRAGLNQEVIAAVRDAAIDVDMVIDNAPLDRTHVDFSFTVSLEDYQQALSISDKMARQFTAREVVGDKDIAKVSLVGLGMCSHAGIASKMFNVLGELGIDVHLLTSSEVKVSAIVAEEYVEKGVQSLHTAFGLDLD